MTRPPTLTSADAQRNYVPGQLIHLGDGPAWKDLLVEIHSRRLQEDRLLVPAVAEPQIVWQISGNVICEERDLGGEWSSHRSGPGDIFLTSSLTPYELRWRSIGTEPLVAMTVFIGLPLLAMASREVLGENSAMPVLKEAYSVRDGLLNGMLEQLRTELMDRKTASKVFVQGVAQSLAVHVVRNYRDEGKCAAPPSPNIIPAWRFRRVESLMAEKLFEGVQISDLAKVAEMSEAHFSRMFKITTGLSPIQYFIRLRIAQAQQLLRETQMSVIQVGMEVGYANPSHFAQVFKKETGLTPNSYRSTAAVSF